ncbi:hypothetical protein SAMN05216550_13813 [Paraburkholderia tropica]|uniref:DUF4142 domain-containing protein n=1 Tax=Paraburkholderia tropica TaxID=92647 RepID=A0AAQ1JYM1_9BURK|nr:hypothetical protein SAMN05216550_13813 [Paraburkholderia tropica]
MRERFTFDSALTGACSPLLAARSRVARLRVPSLAPLFDTLNDGGRSTPARRTFDSPIPIACFAERTPEGQNDKRKSAAQKALPTIEEHYRMSQTLAKKLGAKTN